MGFYKRSLQVPKRSVELSLAQRRDLLGADFHSGSLSQYVLQAITVILKY